MPRVSSPDDASLVKTEEKPSVVMCNCFGDVDPRGNPYQLLRELVKNQISLCACFYYSFGGTVQYSCCRTVCSTPTGIAEAVK